MPVQLLRSLKTRLVLSHTLPILVVVPLLGVALIYQLERYYLLDNLALELAAQGTIIATLTRDEPLLWRSPAFAQAAVERLRERISSHVMLVDSGGHLIAAAWMDDRQRTGELVDSAVVREALNGKVAWTVDGGADQPEQVIDVAIPVTVSRGQIIGVVRLAHSLEEIQRRLRPIRWLVLVTLLIGAGLSLVLGLILARSLGAPLLSLAGAVSRFTPLSPAEPVPESGPDELRTLAAAYNRMSLRLYELERSRTVLLSGIVHELGRPLGSIKAAAETIGNSCDLSLDSELASGINEHVNQLRLQLDDLALLAEVELQGLNIAIELVDISELIYSQCHQFQNLIIQKQLTFSCEPDDDLPLVEADPKRIAQIIGNLLHNAYKYTPSGGKITVSARSEKVENSHGFVILEVTDSGPGIPPGEQDPIFQLFYRGPEQQRIHQGMGIGLALARQLAQAHGGTLTVVDGKKDEGATFALRLPVQQSLDNSTQSPSH